MSRMSKDVFKKRIPEGIPHFKSKLAKDTTTFTWEIKDVEEVRNKDVWESMNCKFKVNKFNWNLSLTSDDRYLYVVPTLVEPQDTTVKFALNIMVLNNTNNVIYIPISGGEQGYVGIAHGKGPGEHKVEVLKFGETNFDYFHSMVYNGCLKLYFEMTVFYDTHGS